MSPREPEAGVVRDPRMPAYYDRLRGTVATIPPAASAQRVARSDQPDDAEEPER